MNSRKPAYKLVIVESPAKARTISKFLGRNYKVEASQGHVRDLPKSQLGVDVEHDFEPKYITIRGRGEVLERIRKEAKGAKSIILATDPDREGEAISWHLATILGIDPESECRVEFNEITEKTVKSAIKQPRAVNMQLVNAQQARRLLDRLVGYKISPLLWVKIKKGLSAGRVQSVATRMVVDREHEIEQFEPEEYWYVDAELRAGGKQLHARLIALDGERVTDADREVLRQIFNRGGFTDGYLKGVVDGTLISRARPSHWGSRVGTAVNAKKIVLTADVLAQDAVAVRPASGEDVPVKLCGRAGESVANPAGMAGDVMRMVSEAQMAQARESWRETARTVGVRAELYIEEGTPARARVTDGANTAEATGWIPETARSAVDEARIRAQFEKTGGTPYRVDEVVVHLSGQPFVPMSGMNALRRDALAALSEKRIAAMRVTDAEVKMPVCHSLPSEGRPERVHLVAQARSVARLAAAKEAGADECAFEPTDVRRGALDAQTRGLTEFFLYLPPVMDEKSLSYVNEWALENDQRIRGVYLTNFGQVGLKWPGEKRYDAALNLANAAAAAFLGAETSVYTPSLELSAKEIEAVGGRRELIVYGRVPLMHLRHCPVNAARGGGRHADCYACDAARAGARTDDSALIDRKRVRFPLSRLAEEGGCVVDVENSVPLSLLKHTGRLPAACGWRMRFTDEDERRVRALTQAFRRLADGERLDETDAEPERITTGHYFRPVD